ncbi:MAG: formate dehydrogenase accessory sulfurtransferase FdhD [Chitinophagales bacterium]
MHLPSISKHKILKVNGSKAIEINDSLAVESPLEIQLVWTNKGKRIRQSISVTMRTPVLDFQLAIGFLFAEGILSSYNDILQIRYGDNAQTEDLQGNVVVVELQTSVKVAIEQLDRHFYTTSSCGVCGKTSIELVQSHMCYYLSPNTPKIAAKLIHQLPHKLRQQQNLFDDTGGIHAAALFDALGNLLCLCEDVGRHNALDKLIGKSLQERRLPLKNCIVLVSGRASFELIQKALMAGIPILAAVGAPSSLAVELAETYNMTLIGFLRNKQFNVYTGFERIEVD